MVEDALHIRIDLVFGEGLNNGHRWVMVGKYRVFYRCDNEVVTVWRIIHCSQDIDEFELIDWVE